MQQGMRGVRQIMVDGIATGACQVLPWQEVERGSNGDVAPKEEDMDSDMEGVDDNESDEGSDYGTSRSSSSSTFCRN